MQWAEFYNAKADGELSAQSACGSDAVLIMDGRFSRTTQAMVARSVGRKRGYAGFSLHAGPRFTEGRETRAVERIDP